MGQPRVKWVGEAGGWGCENGRKFVNMGKYLQISKRCRTSVAAAAAATSVAAFAAFAAAVDVDCWSSDQKPTIGHDHFAFIVFVTIPLSLHFLLVFFPDDVSPLFFFALAAVRVADLT